MPGKIPGIMLKLVSCILLCAISAVTGAITALLLNSRAVAGIEQPPASAAPAPLVQGHAIQAGHYPQSPFIAVADKVSPSVVQITTTRVEVIGRNDIFGDFERLFEGPFGEQFREFFGRSRPQREQRRRREGLGSGVVLSAEGYIATNYHVIKDVDEIQVKLLKEDELHAAEVIGVDEHTDIAVIKIEPRKSLTPAVLGDSDRLRIGEWAVAIGNPFGLEESVTVGVISAMGRAGFPGLPRYQDFIQTDASINLGNSGGALANIKGEVIGINTFIMSPYIAQGLGFAIPINMVKDVYQKLVDYGYVSRGYLGVVPQDITPVMAGRWNLPDTEGVVISNVQPDTPASRAGLRVQDVIREFAGEKITGEAQFRKIVAGTPPGREVEIKIIRDGSGKTLKAVLGELPTIHLPDKDREPAVELGFDVADITPSIAERFSLKDVSGVIVTDVRGGTPAERVLRRGDIIKRFNDRRIENAGDFRSAAGEIKPGDDILLFIQRGDISMFVDLKVE